MTDNSAVQERKKRIAARQERLKTAMPKRGGVRVEPASDDMRKHLIHPAGGIRFPTSGSVEWPHDRFTKRRLADGSVKLATQQQQRRVREASQRAE